MNAPGYFDSSGNPTSQITINPNEGVILKSSSAGGWGAWSKIGGQLASGTGPAVCSKGANSFDVFVQGTDHALWHKSSQGSAWDSLGGYLTSSPAAASPGNGVIGVFVRGSDGALWERGL